MRGKLKNIGLVFGVVFLLLSIGCEKEQNIIYDVNDVNVQDPNASKDYVKSLTEFISILTGIQPDLFQAHRV